MPDGRWYDERDHRSKLVQTWNRSCRPLVILPPPAEDEAPALEAAVHVLTNTLARFLPQATLVIPHGWMSTQGRGGDLATALQEVVHWADSRARFDFTDDLPSKWSAGPIVAIGEGHPADVMRFIPRTGGVYVAPSQAIAPKSEPGDLLGGIIAGCLAARDVFLAASGMHDLRPQKPFLFQAAQTAPRTDVDLGEVRLIGAGGVGSNIVYFVPFLGVKGRFTIIDHDNVTRSNLNRCLLYSETHARTRALKAQVAEEYLRKAGIPALGHPMTYSQHVRMNGRGRPDVVLMMANEEQVWNTLQNNYPPLTFSSATSANWGIHTARHAPINDACVACLLGSHDVAALKLACDEGTVGEGERKAMGVLPFFAPLAAALTLAHVLDTYANDVRPRENMRMTNLKVTYPRVDAVRLGRRDGCVCAYQDLEVYAHVLRPSGM
jgi:hypothetical protein